MPKFFAPIEDCTPLTLVDSSSVRVGDAQPNDVGKATVACNSRCIGEAVVELGMGAKELTPMSGGLNSMATVEPMGPRLEDFAHHWNLFVDQNQFAPLSVIGNDMGFSFGMSNTSQKFRV